MDGRSWADDLPDLPVEEAVDGGSAIESIPTWFWIMLAGVVGITAFSATIRFLFPEDDGPRGLIAITQLTIGLISMAVAHVLVSKYALANDRRLNLNDVLLSWFNVWQPTIAKLPDTCRHVYAMAWGGFAALTAVTIIGGIDYSAPFRVHEKPPEFKPMQMVGAVASAARAQAGSEVATMEEALSDLQSEVAQMQEDMGEAGAASMEEALNELGSMDEKLNGLPVPGSEDGEELLNQTYTMNCFVYGVETNAKNIPIAFLFGGNTRGKDQHVCRIRTEDLPREDFRVIAVQLSPVIVQDPAIETTEKAVWVEPIVTCRIAYKGLTEGGEFKEPEYEARVVQQRGVELHHDLPPETSGQSAPTGLR